MKVILFLQKSKDYTLFLFLWLPFICIICVFWFCELNLINCAPISRHPSLLCTPFRLKWVLWSTRSLWFARLTSPKLLSFDPSCTFFSHCWSENFFPLILGINMSQQEINKDKKKHDKGDHKRHCKLNRLLVAHES